MKGAAQSVQEKEQYLWAREMSKKSKSQKGRQHGTHADPDTKRSTTVDD